jgi:hypothetical protein
VPTPHGHCVHAGRAATKHAAPKPSGLRPTFPALGFPLRQRYGSRRRRARPLRARAAAAPARRLWPPRALVLPLPLPLPLPLLPRSRHRLPLRPRPRGRRREQRDPHVCRLERADVVGAVPHHERHPAGVAQRVEHQLLLLGADAREDLHQRDDPGAQPGRLHVRQGVAC